tara:strand:+ start:317 stop:826 length:510 start_codon:yes stop_codon:yes gene_type:complete
MGMTLIEHIEVDAAGISYIEFLSLPQTGIDLIIKCSLRSSYGTGYQGYITLNGGLVSGTYQWIALNGSGASVSASGGDPWNSNKLPYVYVNPFSDTASTFSSNSVHIANYAGNQIKIASIEGVTENNGTTARQIISGAARNNTDAITSLRVYVDFGQYSSASVYMTTAD